MSNPGIPETGALSVDQAVAQLDLPKKEETSAWAKTEETNSPAEPTAEDTSGAQAQTADNDDQANPGEDAEAEQAEQQPPLEAPKFWDAEAKKRFGDLPRDVQEIILKKEDERNSYVAKTTQTANERTKAFEAETQRLKTLADGLNQFLPQAQQTFQSRWANVDWEKVVDQYGADQALKLQMQMHNEQRQLQALEQTKAQTDALAKQRFTQEQESLMPQYAPDLVDPKEGPARREALGQFLLKAGLSPQRISDYTAIEAGLAYDAMQWRNGKQTAQKLVEAPKQPAPKKLAPAKPAAQQNQGTPQQQRITALSRKKELTIDEAVELANLKGQAA